MMKMGLGQQKGISFEIPRSPFMVTEILGNKFLLTHGDQIKGWNGLPYYGMVRSETRFRTILERTKTIEELLREIEKEDISQEDKNGLLQYALTYAKSFDYMVMGHFHSMAELETNSGGKIILNSSFAGGDDYSINTLMSANSAAQKFFGVHAEGKSWTYDIQLDRE
jgi:UDP-2,3-diacylglucosamine pyrophosphatase LpxH